MYLARQRYGVTIAQNSYGPSAYAVCRDIDKWGYNYFTYDLLLDLLVNIYPDVVHVFAAGSDQGACGKTYGTMRKRAKNGIFVAATTETGDFTSFSSMGPTDDGRLLPTIAAKGASVYSGSLDNGYTYMDGTSMACPTASGTIALLTELYQRYNRGTLRSSYARHSGQHRDGCGSARP